MAPRRERKDVLPVEQVILLLTDRFQIGYFDALILAAARLADCATVYSEDLSTGQDYGGVRVENPLPA